MRTILALICFALALTALVQLTREVWWPRSEQLAPLPACGDVDPSLDEIEIDVIARINDERASVGLPSVEPDETLARVATLRVEDNARTGVVRHVDAEGRDLAALLDQCGADRTESYGEIIGGAYPDAAAVVAAWQESAAHDAIIRMAGYRRIGVAHRRGYFAVVLGT